MLALPPPSTPILRKRQPWLQPFSTSISRYTARSSSSQSKQQLNQNHKRSVFVDPPANLGKRQQEDNNEKKNSSTIVVPSSSKCFKSLEDLNNQTAECLGHGQGVRGISVKQGQDECWVCKCGSTVDEETGKKTNWAGEGCEKKDLSG